MPDCKRCDDLTAENEKLRHKLSPLQDKAFTAQLALAMAKVDFTPFATKLRRGHYIVLSPSIVSREALGDPDPTAHQLSKISRSLQALLWERSYIDGTLVFIMPVTEYEEIKP